MELGVRIRQARLEAGLSQRQLCGDTVTRNMLSQIENGSARPSMQTLQLLAKRLGKPVAWFLEEDALAGARSAFEAGAYDRALEQLSGDTQEAKLLEVKCCLALARRALEEGRVPYGQTLLERAAQVGADCIYYGPELELARRLLLFCAAPEQARDLARDLEMQELKLFLAASQKTSEETLAVLQALPVDRPQWHLLRGQTLFAKGQYGAALVHLEQAEPTRQVLEQLEVCYRETGDFQKAYLCACKLR